MNSLIRHNKEVSDFPDLSLSTVVEVEMDGTNLAAVR